MVLKCHPDKNNGNSAQFLKIKEAYNIILNYLKTRRPVVANTIFFHNINFNNHMTTTGTDRGFTWRFNFG